MLNFLREGDVLFCHSMDRPGRNLDNLRKQGTDGRSEEPRRELVRLAVCWEGEGSDGSAESFSKIGDLLLWDTGVMKRFVAAKFRCPDITK